MPTVGEIDTVLSLAAPKELSESWDNDGVMFCSHANATVNKALVALDATDAAVSFAADNGFEQRINMLSVERGKARDLPGTRQEDQGYGQEEDSCREK